MLIESRFRLATVVCPHMSVVRITWSMYAGGPR